MKKISKYIFLISEFILFVLIFTLKGKASTIVSFLSIINPFLYSLSFNKSKEVVMTNIALFFTVISDLFLVIIEPTYKDIAMISFNIVQICYFLRLLLLSNNKIRDLIIRIALIVFVVIITILVLKDKTDFLSIISMIYYINLILNLVYSFINFKVSPLFAIGLLLFICCDTLIGFDNLSGYLSINESSFIYKLNHLNFNLAWVFYVPSQTLISLSCVDNK